ncbi:MAG: XRE family transcriptional regulator [Prevotellaceae bacterium]|jgi:transcriptional regulator with XRE-family HTH domain|nr:XRE family transcriptional regulator [Prevotellaceae bacterium]
MENLGKRIKQLREAANVSIKDAAKAAGLEPSQIEFIESGEVVPRISLLTKFARCFNVRVGTLLDGYEKVGPVITRHRKSLPTTRLAEEHAAYRSHMDYFSLAEGKHDRNMEPYIVNIHYLPPLQKYYQSHEGEEFFYVIEGEISIYYGNEIFNLSAGDSIYYDSVVPHCVSSNRKDENAKVLAVTYTPF